MNKNDFYRGSMVLLCSALITACGSSSSGGGGGGGSTTTTHSGVAADGYLINATVCLDLNDNKACDSGEPTTTTDEDGAFSLEATQNQIDSNPVILEATAGDTIDKDTGVAVAKDFVLTAPAGSEFVSPLTTLVQAKIEENRYVDGYSVENAVEAIQALLGTDAELLEDYVAKEESDDPAEAAKYQRLHEIAQVATQVIANNSEDAEGAAVEQSAESTPDKLFRLVIAGVVDDIELIADAVDDDTAEEFDPATVFAVVEDDVEMDTTDIDDQVEQQQNDENPVIADIAALVSSTGGLNWLWIELDEGTSEFEALETGTITYDAGTDTTTNIEYEVQSDGTLVVLTPEPRQNRVLTASGWVIEDAETISVTVNSDGSVDFNFQILNGSSSGVEQVTGLKVDVSGQPIASFINSEDGPFDATTIVGDATFSAGAEAYQLTFVTTQESYRLRDWDCEEPTAGMCNTVSYFSGGAFSLATTLSSLIVETAANPEVVAEDSSSLKIIAYGTPAGNAHFELVEDGAINVYEPDEFWGFATKIGTGTWITRTVNGEELIVLSLEASIRSQFDIDGGDLLILAEYNGYVRTGDLDPVGNTRTEAEWVYNGTAWQNIFDNYGESEETGLPAGSIATLISSEGGSNGFKLSLSSTGEYLGFEAGTLTYDAVTGTTQTAGDVGSDGTLVERPLNLKKGLILAASGWSEFDGSVTVTSVNEDGSIDVDLKTTNDETYVSQHTSASAVDLSGETIAGYLVDERVDYDFSELVGDAVFSEGAEAYRATYSFSEEIYQLVDGDGCDNPTDFNGLCNAVYQFVGDGDWNTNGFVATLSGATVATAANAGAIDGPGGAIQLTALRLFGESGISTVVELVDDGSTNFYVIHINGSAIHDGSTTWEERDVNGKTLYVVVITDALRASMNVGEQTNLFFTEHDGYVRIGGYSPGNEELTAERYSFNDIAAQDVLYNFSAPALGCDYESGWDDVNDQPASFNSYTDFLSVVAACGGADTITTEDIAGTTWVDSEVYEGFTESETVVFHVDGTLTFTSIESEGTDVLPGIWSVTDSIVAVQIGSPVSFVDSWFAVDGEVIIYTEDDEWGSDLVLDGTADGEIWHSGFTEQP
ncbi:MAG: hypothetical protein KUG72_02140 [Pseudomonadales bacterium]|nr:hypothetical protein [Pseudomonadales bacterium]